MSQQPPVDSPGPRPEPAGPRSGWLPAPLSDGGRPSFHGAPAARPEQGAPLGGPSLPSVSIQEFSPPRSRLPLLVSLIAVLVAGLIWTGTTWRPAPPSPSASPSTSPGASATPPGLPFVTPDERFTGRWEILRHQWSDAGLEVEIRIAADRGPVTYSFLAFGNNDVQATEAEPGFQGPGFSGRDIPTGGVETGWLFFRLERGATTIILATAGGSQMSALPVAG